MISLEEAIDKFEDLEPEVIMTVNSEKYGRIITELSAKYGADLSTVVMMFIIGELPSEELSNYIEREYEMTAEKSEMAADDLNREIFDPLARRLLFLNADPDKDKEGITVEMEKELLRKIFGENLHSEMFEHFMIKNAVNLRIFDIFEQDLNFKRELERLLYENKELLTGNSIVVSGKTVEPSIGNWLKDFIEKKGTGDFNTIVLSDYMTNSANTKNLSQDERRKIFDLLNLYRNIKFFPDTVSGKPMEEWQIIPFDMTEVKDFIEADNKKLSADEGENEESEELTVEQKLAKYDWTKIVGIERRALLEELGVSLKDFVKWLGERK